MDWASLTAFVAVADNAGFSAAAAQLHLTQPAVSKRIALLEASLGARLFDRLGRQVLQGDAEVALTTLGPTQPPLRSTPIWDDPLHVVVAPDHPLATRAKVTLADLAAHPAVLPDAVTFTHRIVADAFARRGLSLQLRMTTNYLETIKMLVSVGLAWSVLPQTMLDAQVRVLPVAGVKLSRQLGCTVHGGRTLSRAAQAFIGLLKADAG